MYILMFSLAWLIVIGLAAAGSWIEYWTTGSEDASPMLLNDAGYQGHCDSVVFLN